MTYVQRSFSRNEISAPPCIIMIMISTPESPFDGARFIKKQKRKIARASARTLRLYFGFLPKRSPIKQVRA